MNLSKQDGVMTRRGFLFKTSLVLFLLLTLFNVENLSSQTLAFPGAEGFGAYTKGGRGGYAWYIQNPHKVLDRYENWEYK